MISMCTHNKQDFMCCTAQCLLCILQIQDGNQKEDKSVFQWPQTWCVWCRIDTLVVALLSIAYDCTGPKQLLVIDNSATWHLIFLFHDFPFVVQFAKQTRNYRESTRIFRVLKSVNGLLNINKSIDGFLTRLLQIAVRFPVSQSVLTQLFWLNIYHERIMSGQVHQVFRAYTYANRFFVQNFTNIECLFVFDCLIVHWLVGMRGYSLVFCEILKFFYPHFH